MKRLPLLVVAMLCGNAFADMASSRADPAATVQTFLNSFNSGDIDTVESTQLGNVVIVDEFAPFVWQGDGAFRRWLDDLTKHDSAAGISDGHMAMGDTIRQEVSGDHAYLVISTVYSFRENGAAMRASAHMTFALRQDGSDWRIAAWTYSAPGAAPAEP